MIEKCRAASIASEKFSERAAIFVDCANEGIEGKISIVHHCADYRLNFEPVSSSCFRSRHFPCLTGHALLCDELSALYLGRRVQVQ